MPRRPFDWLRLGLWRRRRINPDPEAECPICLVLLRDGRALTQTPCNHLFHATCLDRWLAMPGTHKRICPSCRAPLAARPANARPTLPMQNEVRYEGAPGRRRIASIECFALDTVDFYEGEPGHETLVRTMTSESVDFFSGLCGREHMTRRELTNGDIMHYRGTQEALVRIEYHRGGRCDHFRGAAGHERLVRRTWDHGGGVTFFGPAGAEVPIGPTWLH